MLDIKLCGCGIGTQHSPRTFFEDRKGSGDWLFMYFHTPFVYMSGGLKNGNMGECLLHPPGTYTYHGPADGMTGGFRNDWIYFSGTDADHIIDEYKIPQNRSFPVPDPDGITFFIREIYHERIYRDIGNELKISSDIACMLIEIKRQLTVDYERGDVQYAVMKRVRNDILKNCSDKWTLENMAKLSGYSASRFESLYKKYFRATPITDLTFDRILKAKNMLLYSEYPVGEIAERCGFSSISYFSRVYKRITGAAPTKSLNSGRENTVG